MPYFAIGAVHNMSMSVKTDEDSNCSKTTKTLSKKTFLDLDYEGVDCSFRKLYLEYGIKGGEPDVSLSGIESPKKAHPLFLSPTRKTMFIRDLVVMSQISCS